MNDLSKDFKEVHREMISDLEMLFPQLPPHTALSKGWD